MSKSIYEKAKRDLISLTAKFVIPSVEETDYGCIYDSCHFYNILDEQEESYLKTVEKALEQAQKQEKLLELYKELSLLERKRATTLKTKNTLKYNHYNKIIDFLNRQIKELENETISN